VDLGQALVGKDFQAGGYVLHVVYEEGEPVALAEKLFVDVLGKL
jgi:hypothetical protein